MNGMGRRFGSLDAVVPVLRRVAALGLALGLGGCAVYATPYDTSVAVVPPPVVVAPPVYIHPFAHFGYRGYWGGPRHYHGYPRAPRYGGHYYHR